MGFPAIIPTALSYRMHGPVISFDQETLFLLRGRQVGRVACREKLPNAKLLELSRSP